MKNIIFNSSMPRACSTLLQNVFNQRPDFYGTPTDGLANLLLVARQQFTEGDEFRASKDQDLMLKAWRGFCKQGMHGYVDSLTDRQNVVIKGRSIKSCIPWFEKFLDEPPVVICMVRDLRAIVASFEKLYRKNPEKGSQWYLGGEVRGTTTSKRCDMYLQNNPLAHSLDQLLELQEMNIDNKVLYIRAEDFTERPQEIMSELYSVLKVDDYNHDFNNVEQTTHENDVVHGLDINLHTIRNKVEPLKEDYIDIIGEAMCDNINETYSWYQIYFGYID